MTWILILLMRVSVFIPFRLQVFIGKMIGKLIYPIMSEFRKIAYANISHCFPEKKQPQVTILVKKHFESIEQRRQCTLRTYPLAQISAQFH